MLTPEERAVYDRHLHEDIERIAEAVDEPGWEVALAMAELLRRGLVAPTVGTAEDAVAELEARYPRPEA